MYRGEIGDLAGEGTFSDFPSLDEQGTDESSSKQQERVLQFERGTDGGSCGGRRCGARDWKCEGLREGWVVLKLAE